MLFPITSLCLMACIAGAYRHDGRRSPLVLALGAWAISLLLALPVFFKYAVDYSLKVDLFVASCLATTTVAYLYFRTAPRPTPSTYAKRVSEIRIATIFGVIGVLGCVLLLYDASVNAGLQFSIGYVIDNLSAIRADNFDRLAENLNSGGNLAAIASFMAPCGILTVIASARLGRDGGWRIRWLARVNLLLLAIVSLGVYAGRATIANIVLLVLVSLFVSGRRLSPFRPRTLIVGALLLISVWYLSTTFLGTRERNVNASAILDETQRAELRPWIKATAENDEGLGLAMVSLGYFASPTPTLAFYMQQKPLPGPFYGMYSYPLVSRAIGSLTGSWTPDQWIETRRKIFAPIEARNYAGNVFATWLRDLLVDFGYIGAIVFCGLFGAFMAWARSRYELTGALHYHYLEVLACFTLGFGAFQNALWSSFLAVPFFLALAILVAMRLGLSRVGAGRRSLDPSWPASRVPERVAPRSVVGARMGDGRAHP